MSTIADKSLQALDVFELEMRLMNEDGSITTFGTGETSRNEISQKVESIEVRNGIGMQKRANFRTKKDMSIKTTVNSFNLDIFAYKNGVELEHNSKEALYWWKPVNISVLDHNAIIDEATSIKAVRDIRGNRFKIVPTEPKEGECKIEGNKIILPKDFKDIEIEAIYYATNKGDKDITKITFSGKSFAKNVNLLCHSIIFSEEDEAVVADQNYEFFKCSPKEDFTLVFEGNKVVDQELEFEILVPKLLPNGKLNKDGETGALYVIPR